MTLPGLTHTITDTNSFGQLPGAALASQLVVGKCGGTANTVYRIYDPQDAVTQLVNGPACDLAALIAKYGGGPVYVVPTANNTGAVAYTTAVTSSGTTPPTCTVSGTPLNKYYIAIKIVTAGTQTTAKYQESYDGGTTYGPIKTLAASVTLNDPAGRSTGLTFSTAVGSYAADNLYIFNCAPAYPAAADITAALTAAFNSAYQFGLVSVAGTPQGATDATNCGVTATTFTAFESALASTARTALRDLRGLISGPEIASALINGTNQTTAFDTALFTTAAIGTGVCTGVGGAHVNMLCPITKSIMAVPWAHVMAALYANTYAVLGPQYDASCPGIDTEATGRSVLADVVSLRRDERTQSGGHDAGFMVPRTHLGKPATNFYPASSVMKTASTSDYSILPYGLVMDMLATNVNAFFVDFINRVVPVNPNGTISDAFATVTEANVAARINNGMVVPGYIQNQTKAIPFVKIDRAYNVLTNKKLKIQVRGIPWGYSQLIDLNYAYYVANTATAQ